MMHGFWVILCWLIFIFQIVYIGFYIRWKSDREFNKRNKKERVDSHDVKIGDINGRTKY